MNPSLPQPTMIINNAQAAGEVHTILSSMICAHPDPQSSSRFYETIDAWLGPWGPDGYPAGYGKYYTLAFYNNQTLMRHPAGKNWVERTGMLLQEALRDYIVERIRQGTLESMTEEELRKAAFESHSWAYIKGGLADIALKAPWLLFVIMAIPGREFLPTSPNFKETLNQVLTTVKLLMPLILNKEYAGA